MVEIQLYYKGNLRVEAVHGPSGAVLQTDAPVDNQGEGQSFSPTDLAATSLGACMATIMGIKARDKGIPLDGLRMRVEKHMSDDSPRRIVRIVVEFHVPLPADHPQRQLLEAAAMACPVHHSLHPDIEKDIRWHWEG